jgi:O-antigen/teichoic acid export membrane protein
MKEIQNLWWDYLSLTVSRFILIPLEFLSIILTTRILGAEKYGAVALFISLVQLIFTWGINWTSSSVVRFGKEEFVLTASMRKVFGSRTVLLILCILISLFLFFFLRHPVFGFIGWKGEKFGLIALMVIGFSINNHINYLLQAFGLFRQYSFVPIIEKLSYISILGIVFFFSNGVGMSLIIELMIVAKLIAILFGGLFLKGKPLTPLTTDWKTLKNIFLYSWPFFFAFSSGYISDWFDLFVIKYFLALKDVGIYQAAYQGMASIGLSLMAITSITFPIITALKTTEREESIRRYLIRVAPQIVLTISLVITLLMLLATPRIIGFIFGRDFTKSAFPLLTLMLCNALMGISVIYSSILVSYDLTKEVTIISIIMAAINLGLDILLIPRIGMIGAAIATVISYGFSSTAYLLLGNQRLKINQYRSLFCLIPAFLGFAVCMIIPVFWERFLLIGFIWVLSFVVASMKDIFLMEDLTLLEKIHIPLFLKEMIQSIFRLSFQIKQFSLSLKRGN